MGLTIGILAKQAGLGVQTLRFYEREGLLDEPARASSGYRTYDEGALSRLRVIRRAQELGFTLKEIKELIALQEEPVTDCDRVRVAAQAKVRDMERKIADLTRMKAELDSLIDTCQSCGTVGRCAVMDCLSGC